MNEQRRGQRSVLSTPGMATVRLRMDVELTRLDEKEAAVITTQALPSGERVLLEIPAERGAASNARLVRTGKIRLVLSHSQLRREVELAFIGHTGIWHEHHPVDHAAPMTATAAAVIRRVPVRLVEVSVSGCLWDAAVPMDEGNVGFLEVRTRGQCRTEAVRVSRRQATVDSNWPYRMAVEFLTLAPASPDSLRGVAVVVATGSPSGQGR
jgi:hypothetical protein